MKVDFITITPDAEKMIAYIARVSNPKNQDNQNFAKLLKYCIKHKHWSIFEQASLTLEIETSLAIATQILRHRSFTFQQFSQRYARSDLLQNSLPMPDLRRQDNKNRQNSIDDIDENIKKKFYPKIEKLYKETMNIYKEMLDSGIAKECARFILPQSTKTKLYMTGNIRSWIHYIDLRSANGTQKEHMDIAIEAKKIFKEKLPIISEALNWI